MKKTARIISLGLLALLLSVGVWGMASGALAPTTVRLAPATLQLETGEQFSIQVLIEDVADMQGASVYLAYDPERLQMDIITPGDMFPLGDSTSYYEINNEAGELTYAIALLGQGEPIAGDGVLCEFRGRTLRLGDARVAITKAELADSNIQLIPVEVFDAVLRVGIGRAYLPVIHGAGTP